MQQIDHSNKLFMLASELVNHTGKHIFLTGKAGTGKTTFLKYIRNHCPKQMAVVAPTGVAAINAGGVTIHSFFQLPISPFIPEERKFEKRNDEVVNSHSLINRMRLTAQKKQVLQELELLIIDEISMVRCDTLDAIDVVLRHVRHKYHERFGGVQVLFIGDMFQLPPVVKEAEWSLLSPYYSSPYFFDSRVMREEQPVYIEFNKIYRQTEEKFIRVLNQVRNNELDQEGFALLKERYQPLFKDEEHEGYIILTTHNEKAKNLNVQRLAKLETRIYNYTAEIKDEFFESSYPADQLLQLKVGAQVMFIKNDPDKKYFNGKLGVVSELTDEKILVQCKDDDYPIEVNRESWENIRYKLNPSSRQLEEEVLGSFVQYPLRLAWAITIHKSQGLTFPKAVIDAGYAFAPGQVYVALSRCTGLEGMVLKSEINASRLLNDKRIVEFSTRNASSLQLESELKKAKKQYMLNTLVGLFDFNKLKKDVDEIFMFFSKNISSFNSEALGWIEDLSNGITGVQQTAEKFWPQLKNLFEQDIQPDQNNLLQERIHAAFQYFSNQLEKLIAGLSTSPAITDSRIHAKEYNELVSNLFNRLSLQKFLMNGHNGLFTMESYHSLKKSFVSPPFSINAYAGAARQKKKMEHEELFQQLKMVRDKICNNRNLPVYMVAGSKALEEMATCFPQNKAELKQINGFGKVKVESYGSLFLDVINKYCEINNISSRMEALIPKREKRAAVQAKSSTRMESFKLFKQGKSISEIALERKLSTSTIESHLHFFISTREITLEELVDPEKIELISFTLDELKSLEVSPIKQKLGDAVSYGDIRAVISWKVNERIPSGSDLQ